MDKSFQGLFPNCCSSVGALSRGDKPAPKPTFSGELR
jgi:hypothetical protein